MAQTHRDRGEKAGALPSPVRCKEDQPRNPDHHLTPPPPSASPSSAQMAMAFSMDTEAELVKDTGVGRGNVQRWTGLWGHVP